MEAQPVSQSMQYAAVLLLVVFATVMTAGMLIASAILGKRAKRTPIKDSAYECGMLPLSPAPARLSVKFYIVAMLFILFDIELVFLYPWAVVYRDFLKTDPNLILGAMFAFVGVLLVGYLYAVKKRAFDWSV
jgi:NADH-quinone oxidoreductase subunit A